MVVSVLMPALVAPTLRAPASAAATPSNGQGQVVIVGDSLMEGTAVYGSLASRVTKRKIWTGVVLDYKRGRTTVQGTRTLAQRLARAENPTAVVIALGTNDMLSHADPGYPSGIIDALMNEALGLPVLWVNVTFSRIHPDWRARASRFNRALRAAQSEWPTLRVADWSRTFVPSGRSNYIADGIHLSTSAYRARAAWLDSQIAAFGRFVVDSTSTTTSTTPPTTTTSDPPTTTAAGTSVPSP